jgi:hypothetical protein
MNPAYEKRVKQQQKRYGNLRRFNLTLELSTLKSYRNGLYIQLKDINLSIDALNRMIRRARTVSPAGTAS